MEHFRRQPVTMSVLSAWLTRWVSTAFGYSLSAGAGEHRGRVDVAVYPETTEGLWLQNYLKSKRIPYFAFRAAVPHQATGAHIHVGPGSTRLAALPATRLPASPNAGVAASHAKLALTD